MLRFEWGDEEYGFHECMLYEDDNEIDDICFWDYTSKFHQENDAKSRYTRPYAFEVSWCHGLRMSRRFDYDEDFDNHLDENGWRTGGYQGNCTHTVDDIKKWCENWLAQRYIDRYNSILSELEICKRRAEWFEANGYGNPEKVD